MKCKNCLKEIADGILFCPYCGSKIDTTTTASTETQNSKTTVENLNTPTPLTPSQNPSEVIPSNFNIIVEKTQLGGVANLFFILTKEKGIQPKTAAQICQHLPFTLYEDVPEEKANMMIIELSKKGIDASISIPQELPNDITIKELEEKDAANVVSAVCGENKSKYMAYCHLNTFSSILFAVVSFLILLLPILDFSIDGETLSSINNSSILSIIIASIKSLIGVPSSDFLILSWVYLILGIAISAHAIWFIVSSIKNATADIKFIIELKKHSNKETIDSETTKSIQKFMNKYNMMKGNNAFSQIIIDIILILLFLSGGNHIIWASIITIVILGIIAFVCEKIANKQKAKLFN